MNSIYAVQDKNIEFEDVVPPVLNGIKSKLSKKQYRSTYNQWQEWSAQNGLNPFDMNSNNATLFLKDLKNNLGKPLTESSRSNKLAHLRKFAKYLKIHVPQFGKVYDDLMFMVVPSEDAGNGHRETTDLSQEQIRKIMRYFKNKARMIDVRNRLVIELGLATGMRVSEMAKLRWDDIDLDQEILVIQSGKGGKKRHLAIVPGRTIKPINTLLELRAMYGDIEYVFPAIYKDIPDQTGHITADNMSDVVERISNDCDIYFTHHTLRRTHITEMYRLDKDISGLMAQSGHSNADILFKHYIQGVDAKDRREKWSEARW